MPARTGGADLGGSPTKFAAVKWQRVFCFAERADAEKFQGRFGGVWFDPAQRGRGNSWMRIKRLKPKFY